MARVEVICPHCKGLQQVPDKKLQEPWVCMLCKGTIDDPFLHKKKSPPPKLAIPLHGKIISASGITNLSEIVASSEEYSKGFDPSTIMIPGSFDLSSEMPQSRPVEVKTSGSSGWLVMLLFFLVVALGSGAFVWFVIVPMTR
jgi:hypothetical protein